MAARTRSRIVVLLVILAVISAIREYSIRRHEADLHAWPVPEDPSHDPTRTESMTDVTKPYRQVTKPSDTLAGESDGSDASEADP